MKINTGKGTITLSVLLAIWSISAITSLPGLAISPILGDLNHIFPSATDLEIQMLSSLPSLLIIPFVLLAGRLSVRRDKLRILLLGLFIFFLSGVACLFANSMRSLILISCILGVGAGMVTPFSTGLIVDYFSGEERVRQLGYSSAINNLSLVLATALTGYLAGVNWHLPFLVYTLPGISILLAVSLRKSPTATPDTASQPSLSPSVIHRHRLGSLMIFYFAITFATLVISFYTPFLVEEAKMENSFSGVLISIFFLAIMLPGLFLRQLLRAMRQYSNPLSLLLSAVGLLLIALSHGKALWVAGALFTGLGYGVMQPLVYDKTASITPAKDATLALSFIMAMNYLAVVVCPMIIDLLRPLFHAHTQRFSFLLAGLLLLAMALWSVVARKGFTFGLAPAYYEKRP